VTILQTLAAVISFFTFMFIVKNTNFKNIVVNKKFQHIVFGFTTLIFVLWLFRVSIYDGLIIHFIALTTLTLVLGFRWAMLSASFVLLILTAIGYESWSMLGVNALLGVYLPILVSYGIFVITFHKLPRHPFVYLFLCGFFPGAITIGLKMLSLSAYFYLDGVYEWDVIVYNYTNMIWLMIFPEAFFNGFSMTCLVIYKPDLIYTFHDKFYIDNK